MKSPFQRDICTPILIAALFIIDKTQKQPVPTTEWMEKLNVCISVWVAVYVFQLFQAGCELGQCYSILATVEFQGIVIYILSRGFSCN